MIYIRDKRPENEAVFEGYYSYIDEQDRQSIDGTMIEYKNFFSLFKKQITDIELNSYYYECDDIVTFEACGRNFTTMLHIDLHEFTAELYGTNCLDIHIHEYNNIMQLLPDDIKGSFANPSYQASVVCILTRMICNKLIDYAFFNEYNQNSLKIKKSFIDIFIKRYVIFFRKIRASFVYTAPRLSSEEPIGNCNSIKFILETGDKIKC